MPPARATRVRERDADDDGERRRDGRDNRRPRDAPGDGPEHDDGTGGGEQHDADREQRRVVARESGPHREQCVDRDGERRPRP